MMQLKSMRSLLIAMMAATGLAFQSTPRRLSALQHRVITQPPPERSTAIVQFATPAATVQPEEMDETLYNFNKFVIDTVYKIICVLYDKNDYARFYVLETVARVPYFAYLSVMHLRETFGARDPKDKDRMRTHYAEADNELHHLLIMESLGGNSSVVDRTLAQTMAFVYYWYVVGVYSISEQAAYHLSELIEDHAYNTYNTFLTKNEAKLKSLPVPAIAKRYYEQEDPFMFELFCTVPEPGSSERRVWTRDLKSLYDVFVNVRNDEREHWKTLCNLVQYDDTQGVAGEGVRSTKAAPKPIEG